MASWLATAPPPTFSSALNPGGAADRRRRSAGGGHPGRLGRQPGRPRANDVFGRDVAVVPREQPFALARDIVAFLLDKRRTDAATRDLIEEEFRPTGVAAKYRALYQDLLARGDA